MNKVVFPISDYNHYNEISFIFIPVFYYNSTYLQNSYTVVLTFEPNVTTKNIIINILDDTIPEFSERLSVHLTSIRLRDEVVDFDLKMSGVIINIPPLISMKVNCLTFLYFICPT